MGILLGVGRALADVAIIKVQADAPGRSIGPDLVGVFFEDINYAADGGLYAELIQNRSFEYQATEQKTWNPLSYWDVQTPGGGRASLDVEAAAPLNANNPHYAVLEVSEPGQGVGLANPGFDGIRVEAGGRYRVSLFARQLYVGNRWGGSPHAGHPAPLTARLESKSGQVLGEVALGAPGWEWTRLTNTITATQSEAAARFVLVVTNRGGMALDEVSLFPENTFRGRPNGLRPDLAQAIADLHPKFIRFPGGCVAHGNGLGNLYRWKDTIGPVEERHQQANLWGYHQSVGLGYFEYFQFCEDIGAKPLPVVAAGVCCQNSGHTGGTGQEGLPLAAMPAYVQDILDLIEWANGPATSVWGAKRAAAGHPEPFHLQYLGVGNEDAQTEVFRTRFKMIYEAVKAQHPEITVIGTVGPFPDGPDYDAGWQFANELHVPMVDEHYYEKPEWFWDHLNRYDGYDRSRSQVYLGEYAAHDAGRANTLRSALAEAAHLTALEHNGDVVRLASYAPLLAKQGRTQWRPDLIYFDNQQVLRTVNYFVQQLFSLNQGDVCLPTTCSGVPAGARLAISSVSERRSGDLIMKLVNGQATLQPVRVSLAGVKNIAPEAVQTVLAGDPTAVNDFNQPLRVEPVTSRLKVGPVFDCELPAHSLTVLRVKTR